jgi:hypothetical protein
MPTRVVVAMDTALRTVEGKWSTLHRSCHVVLRLLTSIFFSSLVEMVPILARGLSMEPETVTHMASVAGTFLCWFGLVCNTWSSYFY